MSYTYAPKPSQTRQKGRGRAKTNTGLNPKPISTDVSTVGKPRNSTLSKTKHQETTSTPVRGNVLGGRGRGTGISAGDRKIMDPSMDDDYSAHTHRPNYNSQDPETARTQPQAQEQAPGQAGRMKRQDAYTMISPNEKKRQQIASQAARETENYERYKANQRPERVSYVGTVGGDRGSISEDAARTKLQKEQQQAKFNRLQKSQQYRTDQKRREDEEYQRKKDQARQQAQENKLQDKSRQSSLREEHRRTNEAFLKRFEKEQKMKKYKTPAATKTQDPSAKPGLLQTSSSADTEGATAVFPSSSSATSTVDQLVHMYPQCDHQILQDLLVQCNGDIDAVSQLIG